MNIEKDNFGSSENGATPHRAADPLATTDCRQPTAAASDASCFHCDEPLNGSKMTARIRGRSEPVCCAGCLAVAELIAGAGLEDFYRYRSAPSVRPVAQGCAEDMWTAYDRPEIAVQFVTRAKVGNTVSLVIDGMRCAACSWLIERAVHRSPGVGRIDVNAATGRAYIEWDGTQTTLGSLLRTIAQLGYRPYPASDEGIANARQDERRRALQRLAVGGLGMMQVMMFAVATYSAELAGEIMDAQLLDYFRLVSLLVATPVLLYAGKPFFVSAWNSMRARTIGMDVPISLALALAFGASVWNTLAGSGEVYFDSVTMFVFFLTLGRFIEMTARHRTTSINDALARHVPAMAHRMRRGEVEDIPTAAVEHEDSVLVRAGEIIPVDGCILQGETRVDEALLTGESVPVHRGCGDSVCAGTLNAGSPIVIKATAIGSSTLLSGVVSMLQQAQSRKPAVAQAADRAAATFLRYVLLASGAVCAAWLAIDPSRAFEATLAVLVVACPCAFSIAMPAALAAATGELARQGVLVAHPDAIEALSKIRHVIFDKTGTLTRGEVRLHSCTQLASLAAPACLRIAAGLESRSEHPIAKAFLLATGGSVADGDAKTPSFVRTSELAIAEVHVSPGLGIEGVVDGVRYRLGTAGFVAALRGESMDPGAASYDCPTVTLGDESEALALFTLSDSLRDDSAQAVAMLGDLGIATEILSGDAPAVVRQIAEQCAIERFSARQSPSEKLERVRTLQASGATVTMIGDGINDAPVLGAADVSIAMGRGAALALAAADIVLVGERMIALPSAIRTAHRTMQIARQNLVWSAAYNFCALPLAALGLIAPWAAAIGMSISSIAVVMNAMRVGAAGNWQLATGQKRSLHASSTPAAHEPGDMGPVAPLAPSPQFPAARP